MDGCQCSSNIRNGDELQILCVISPASPAQPSPASPAQPSPAQVLYRCRRLQWIIWSSNTLYEHTIAISGSGRAWCVCVLLIGTQQLQHACNQWWTIDNHRQTPSSLFPLLLVESTYWRFNSLRIYRLSTNLVILSNIGSMFDGGMAALALAQ